MNLYKTTVRGQYAIFNSPKDAESYSGGYGYRVTDYEGDVVLLRETVLEKVYAICHLRLGISGYMRITDVSEFHELYEEL